MFKKILVANRGEIAIRAFRAAYELGARTVAVFPYEDRNSSHRLKADEAYQIGSEGHPVRAYLNVAEIIRVAKESGADAIYPGYGFLSENPELAQAAAENGIKFIGDDGWIFVCRDGAATASDQKGSGGAWKWLDASDPKLLDPKGVTVQFPHSLEHHKNWLECVKSRQTPLAPAAPATPAAAPQADPPSRGRFQLSSMKRAIEV